MELSDSKAHILDAFEKSERRPFLVKRIDEHVFIKFEREFNHFWSPQLHLEIEELENGGSRLFGTFGPNPTLWTFFMFLHFGVATLFVILGIWAYSSASLNRPYQMQTGLMLLLIVAWFALYAFGRMGKRKGKPQMRELYRFMGEVLA
jgi:hypothetical protein